MRNRSAAVVAGMVWAAACSSSGGMHAAGTGGSTSTSSAGGTTTGGGAPDAGGCGGTTCMPDEQCCAGVCVVTQACTFALTSVTPGTAYQSGGDWLTLKGAGFAKGMRVWVADTDGQGDGRAPVLVVDPGTATVRAPPGPVGVHDVRIEMGATQATLRGALTYASGGLLPPWVHVSMSKVRGEWPALAVLRDGRVLIAGGATTPDDPSTSLDTVELFSRDMQGTGQAMLASSTMSTVRWRAAAVTLLDGTVLVVGGACWPDGTGLTGDATAADIFDPTTGMFAKTTQPLNKARCDARAVLLPDGRAFITSANDASAEIYDPGAQTFSVVMPGGPHPDGFLVRLRDGRVLLAAGLVGSTPTAAAEIFDPDTGMFAATGSLATARYFGGASTLPDGRVLVLGGAQGNTGNWMPLDSIEIFDPMAGAFATAPFKLSVARYGLAATLVRDGTVLAIAGYTTPNDCSKVTASVDVVDTVMGKVADFGSALPEANAELNATTTLDGSVVVVGGGACNQSFAQPYIDFLAGQPVPK